MCPDVGSDHTDFTSDKFNCLEANAFEATAAFIFRCHGNRSICSSCCIHRFINRLYFDFAIKRRL